MFGSDGSPIVQYVVIFAVIFTALAAIVFVVRRLTGRGLALPGRAGTRGRQPRLGIVDVYELDRARQLILLRRDNVEHLLLVGGPNDVVIERNIQRGQRPLPEAALRPEAPAEPTQDPLPEGGRLPEPPRPLPEIAGRRADPPFDPGFAMPVVVRPPVPGSGAAPPVTLPLDAALLGGDEPGQDIAAPLTAPPRAGRPSSPAPGSASAAPPDRAASARRGILRRTAPPPVEPRPEPPSEPPSDLPSEGGPDGAQDGPGRSRAEAAAPGPPPLAVPAERRSIDPVILADMARQLQAALARPASAVTPAPAPVPPAAEPPASPGPVDPVAAAMASTPPPPAPEPPAPEASRPRKDPPAAAKAPVPQAQPAAMPDAAPPPQGRQAPVAGSPAAPAPEPAPKPSGNPFSVEEIEAEFARLLGRPLDKRG